MCLFHLLANESMFTAAGKVTLTRLCVRLEANTQDAVVAQFCLTVF